MRSKLNRLIEKREELMVQAASQRALLRHHSGHLRAPLAMLDKGVDAAKFIRHNPTLLFGSGAILFGLLRLTHTSKWLRRGLWTWQILRQLSPKNRPIKH